MVDILKIDGVTMPSPSSYSVTSQDIVEAGRNTKGDMHLDYITTKQKVELSWTILSNEDRQKIMNAIKSPQHLTFDVTCILLSMGVNESFNCYKGDISAGIVIFKAGKPYWKDFKVNFIEM